MADNIYQGWIAVYTTGYDYEADLVRGRLDDAGLKAVVLSKRDHALNLTVGDLAEVFVMVPPEQAEQARAVLAEAPLTTDELEAAQNAADALAPDAHTPEEQTMLDSGNNKIRLSTPDADE